MSVSIKIWRGTLGAQVTGVRTRIWFGTVCIVPWNDLAGLDVKRHRRGLRD